MSYSELTCKELVEVVTDYLEGTMPAGQRARVEAHLETCDGCRTYVEQMRTTIRLTGMLREEDVSPEARETLLANFRTWKRQPSV